MTYEQLGQIIKNGREAKNMTQQELAKKVGVGISAISNWETGISAPRTLDFIELVKLLDLIDQIFPANPNKRTDYHVNLEQLKVQLTELQKSVNILEKIKI